MKYDELDHEQRLYVNKAMSGVGVDPRNVPEESLDALLANRVIGESSLHRLHRAGNAVAEYRRQQHEAAEADRDPLDDYPTEAEALCIAAKMNVNPAYIKTREQVAGELAVEKEQQQQALARQILTDAIEAGDRSTLLGIGQRSKDAELRTAARIVLKDMFVPAVYDTLFDAE